MSVIALGDIPGVSTQLRLVEPPEPTTGRASRRRRTAGRSSRGRAVRAGRGRSAHWASEWRLDAATRHVGRRGVAAARAALAEAQRPGPDPPPVEGELSKAS